MGAWYIQILVISYRWVTVDIKFKDKGVVMMEFLVEAVEEKTTLQLNNAGCTVECFDVGCIDCTLGL